MFLAMASLEAEMRAPTVANGSYANEPDCNFDFWAVPGKADAPLIILIHGGGFIANRRQDMNGTVEPILRKGFAVMNLDYPLLTKVPVQRILHLCARAVQYARANATKWGIDPKRIACMGGSAGAGASLWIAVHPDLADPTSPDPVARESSRISAAGLADTQSTYNMYRWKELVGLTGKLATMKFFSPETLYHFKENLETAPTDPTAAAMLEDVDMYGMIGPDTPPLIMRCKAPNTPPVKQGDFVHHPLHDEIIIEKAKKFNVVTDYAAYPPDGTVNPFAQIADYFVEHPLKPVP